MSRNGTERSDVSDAVNFPDAFGGCPVCGGNDGFLNVGRAHWFMCNKHKTKWCVGDNWFRCWRLETEDIWRDNLKLLTDYREVPFVSSERPKAEREEAAIPDEAGIVKADVPSNVLAAMKTIVGYLWHDEEKHCRESDAQCRKQHVFNSLIIVRNWLDDDTQ